MGLISVGNAAKKRRDSMKTSISLAALITLMIVVLLGCGNHQSDAHNPASATGALAPPDPSIPDGPYDPGLVTVQTYEHDYEDAGVRVIAVNPDGVYCSIGIRINGTAQLYGTFSYQDIQQQVMQSSHFDIEYQQISVASAEMPTFSSTPLTQEQLALPAYSAGSVYNHDHVDASIDVEGVSSDGQVMSIGIRINGTAYIVGDIAASHFQSVVANSEDWDLDYVSPPID
jgi:hypothetical protein